jgi:hypothetical protein
MYLSLILVLAPDTDVFFLMPLKAGTSFQRRREDPQQEGFNFCFPSE